MLADDGPTSAQKQLIVASLTHHLCCISDIVISCRISIAAMCLTA
jgi:hypothetical protein